MTSHKNIKKCILVLGSAFLLVLTAGGCGSTKESQRYSWPLATASPEDTVTQIFAEKFAEETYRLSNGQIKIQVYPNSTLGGDRDLLETCADGDIPFIVQNTAPQVSFMSDLAVLIFPASLTPSKAVAKRSMIPNFRH